MKVTVAIETEDGKKKVTSEPISIKLIESEDSNEMNNKTIDELADLFSTLIKNDLPHLLRKYSQEKNNG